GGRRRRRYYRPPMMEPERPGALLDGKDSSPDSLPDSETSAPEAGSKPGAETSASAPDKAAADSKQAAASAEQPATQSRPRRVLRDVGALETGEQAELRKNTVSKRELSSESSTAAQGGAGGQKLAEGQARTAAPTLEAYEFLTVKVAQKYFFDRTFG